MTDGIAVDLAVRQPGDCPVASASAACDAPVDSVSRASTPDSDGAVAEEFELPAGASPADESVEAVASFGSHDVFRFRREPGAACVCEVVEQSVGPVADVRAREGTLHLSFYAEDLADVRGAVSALEEAFGGVRVRQLTRAATDDCSYPVIVDRNRLTERQREVLRTAHELGYFDYPKGANAGEVADELGIASSTLREHLAVAQGKLLAVVFEDGSAD